MRPLSRFFIFGYFGWFNAGDDAIGVSVIREVLRRHPDAIITVTCNDSYFQNNFICNGGAGTVNLIGFDNISILRAILQSDYFIITGGTHFHDEDGLNLRRVKILGSFLALTCFARVLRRPPLLLGHGIGPLNSTWSRIIVKRILANSGKILVRDEDSFELVSRLGFGDTCRQGFDCSALLVKPDPRASGSPTPLRGNNRIGISLLPVFGIYSNNDREDQRIIQSMVKCMERILHHDDQVIIRLLAFRTGQRHSDLPVLKKFMEQLNVAPESLEISEYNGNILDFMKRVGECDYCIGMRYHASVFAYLLEKPQVIMDYMGKCTSLGRDIGIHHDGSILINELDEPWFCERIHSLLKIPDHFIARLPVGVAISRTENMFDALDEDL